jgi:hypothetical protein
MYAIEWTTPLGTRMASEKRWVNPAEAQRHADTFNAETNGRASAVVSPVY